MIVERLLGDPEASLTTVRRIGVLDLCRQRALLRTEHEHPSVSDGGFELEATFADRDLLLDLFGKVVSLERTQRTADPAIEDGPAVAVLLDGCEVHPVREVSVLDLDAGSNRLYRSTAGVVLAWVVAEYREDRDVGLGRDPLADRDHIAVLPTCRERIKVGRSRRFEGRLSTECIERVVTETVEDHVEELLYGQLRHRLDDRGELGGLKRGATDETAIDVRLRHQGRRVARLHAASVQDADLARNL